MINLLALVEALVFAQKSEADLEKAINTAKAGTVRSWQLANLGTQTIKRDFSPGFMVDLVQKDMRLVMEATAEMKLPLPVTGFINQMYYSPQHSGEGGSGTQALVKALERTARVEAQQPEAR